MAGALILNATHEPLTIVSWRRAVVLVLRGKAEVVADRTTLVHAEHVVVPRPSVIRLIQYVHVPFRREATLSRRAVFIRDRNMCQYCGKRAENIDHVMPKSRGGEHRWENVVAACRQCNGRKRNRTPSEAGLILKRVPRPPRDFRWIAASAGSIHPDWEEYLGAA